MGLFLCGSCTMRLLRTSATSRSLVVHSPALGGTALTLRTTFSSSVISLPNNTNVQQGIALSKGSLRNGTATAQTPTTRADDAASVTVEKKRRGFMGSILRRNRSSTTSVPQVSSSVPSSPIPTTRPLPTAPTTQAPDSNLSDTSPLAHKLLRRYSDQPKMIPRTASGHDIPTTTGSSARMPARFAIYTSHYHPVLGSKN